MRLRTKLTVFPVMLADPRTRGDVDDEGVRVAAPQVSTVIYRAIQRPTIGGPEILSWSLPVSFRIPGSQSSSSSPSCSIRSRSRSDPFGIALSRSEDEDRFAEDENDAGARCPFPPPRFVIFGSISLREE